MNKIELSIEDIEEMKLLAKSCCNGIIEGVINTDLKHTTLDEFYKAIAVGVFIVAEKDTLKTWWEYEDKLIKEMSKKESL